MGERTIAASLSRETTRPHLERTGPLGRLARLILAVFLTYALASIIDEGGLPAFRKVDLLQEPGLWMLGAVTVTLFVYLVADLARAWKGNAIAVRVRIAALLALAVSVLLAAVVGLAVSGEVWGFPLADLVWWFYVVMLIETIVALLIAMAIGTPGCDVGVWSELIWGVRGGRRSDLSWVNCIVGLHLLDQWELGRRRTGGTTQEGSG
jgi:hypothetical protein